MATDVDQEDRAAVPVDLQIIDCDVHNDVPRGEALFPYLPDYWIEHLTNTLFKGATESPYPAGAPVAARPTPTRPTTRPTRRRPCSR